jgi:hypothetical protein
MTPRAADGCGEMQGEGFSFFRVWTPLSWNESAGGASNQGRGSNQDARQFLALSIGKKQRTAENQAAAYSRFRE